MAAAMSSMSKAFHTIALVLFTSSYLFCDACTVSVSGSLASYGSFPLVSHTDDNGFTPSDLRLVRVPSRSLRAKRPVHVWAPNYPRVVDASIAPDYAPSSSSQPPFVPIGYIPEEEETSSSSTKTKQQQQNHHHHQPLHQKKETYAYLDLEYALANEVGLAVAESSCTANTVGWPVNKPGGYNLLSINELSKIALERCSTSRCAISVMGSLAEKYGFYDDGAGSPDAPDYTNSAEALAVVSAEDGEAWIFNILTGDNNASAIWAAQRVPDDAISVIANSFTIREIDFDNHETFMYSANVTALALKMGWWDPQKDPKFDFYASYGFDPMRSMKNKKRAKQLQRVLRYYSGRRMWRAFQLLAPNSSIAQSLDPLVGNLPRRMQGSYPFAIRVSRHSVRVDHMKAMMRDHYEGTRFDLTKGMAAGPYGDPNRPANTAQQAVGQFERAISMHRTLWSFVVEVHKSLKSNMRDGTNPNLSTAWFGYGMPHGTVYLPFYPASKIPPPRSFRSRLGLMSNFSMDSAWWAFNFANQYASTNFRAINADIRAKSETIERRIDEQKLAWETSILNSNSNSGGSSSSIMEQLGTRAQHLAQSVVDEWWPFAFQLMAKYGQGLVVYNETYAERQEYPAWWLDSRDVGFSTWQPNGPYHGVPDDEEAPEEVEIALS